jgi:repressor LexA
MKLRPRQQQMLDFIRRYQREHGYPPTLREIGAAVGISSTSVVNYNLERLEALGFLVRNRETSRGLRLVEPEEPDGAAPGAMVFGEEAAVRAVPFYGAIAAGLPIPVPDDPTAVVETVMVPEMLLPRSGEAFALRVRGHSMVDALVDDGDIILVRHQPRVENGEMAVVEILEPPEQAGATLKRFYERDGHVELRAASPDPVYKTPFVFRPDQVRVHGKVVGVLRRYD